MMFPTIGGSQGGFPMPFAQAGVQLMSAAELARLEVGERHLIAMISAEQLMEIADEPPLFLQDPLLFEELRDLSEVALLQLTSADLDRLYGRIPDATFQAWAPKFTVAQVRGISNLSFARVIKDLRFADGSPIAPHFSGTIKEDLGLTFEQDLKEDRIRPPRPRSEAPSPRVESPQLRPQPPKPKTPKPTPNPLKKYRVTIPTRQKNCSIITLLAFFTIAGLGIAGTLGYNLSTRLSLFNIATADSVIFIGLSLCGSFISLKFLRKYCSE